MSSVKYKIALLFLSMFTSIETFAPPARYLVRRNCARLLQTRFGYSETIDPFDRKTPQFIYDPRIERENTICGPVSLACGLSGFEIWSKGERVSPSANRIAVDLLARLARRTRRNVYDTLYAKKGYEIVHLREILERYLEENGLRFEIQLYGRIDRRIKPLDLEYRLLTKANDPQFIIIALLRTSGYGGALSDFKWDPNDHDGIDRQDETIFRRGFSLISNARGHFVLLESARPKQDGTFDVLINDPDRDRRYVANLRESQLARVPYTLFRVIRPRGEWSVSSPAERMQDYSYWSKPPRPYLVHNGARVISALLILQIRESIASDVRTRLLVNE